MQLRVSSWNPIDGLVMYVMGVPYNWNIDDAEFIEWLQRELSKDNRNKGRILEQVEKRYGKGKKMIEKWQRQMIGNPYKIWIVPESKNTSVFARRLEREIHKVKTSEELAILKEKLESLFEDKIISEIKYNQLKDVLEKNMLNICNATEISEAFSDTEYYEDKYENRFTRASLDTHKIESGKSARELLPKIYLEEIHLLEKELKNTYGKDINYIKQIKDKIKYYEKLILQNQIVKLNKNPVEPIKEVITGDLSNKQKENYKTVKRKDNKFEEMLDKEIEKLNSNPYLYHGTGVKFDKFKLKSTDIGIHFGTLEQAKDRLLYKFRNIVIPKTTRIIGVDVNIKNPLRLNDAGWFNADNLEFELLNTEKFTIEELNKAKSHNKRTWLKNLKDLIIKKGYDGIVYKNTGEVKGYSKIQKEIDKLWKYLAIKHPSVKSGSISVKIQETPEYREWKNMFNYGDKFREDNAEDSYIAFYPSQITNQTDIPLNKLNLNPNTKKQFIGTCVDNPFKTTNKLISITDNAKEISRKEFLENVDLEGIERFRESLLKVMKEYPNDFEFYKNGDIYFYIDSMIEHFYK